MPYRSKLLTVLLSVMSHFTAVLCRVAVFALTLQLIEICQKMNSELLESTKEIASVRKCSLPRLFFLVKGFSHTLTNTFLFFSSLAKIAIVVCYVISLSTAQSKKLYGESEKITEEARSKYTEAETRLKKRDVKFFESVSSLEKQHNKASERLKQCQRRTTACRNDYLLAIATTNAHLKRHCTRDLPKVMQVRTLDGSDRKWLLLLLWMVRLWMVRCTTRYGMLTRSTGR